MNRRTFTQSLLGAAAAVALGPTATAQDPNKSTALRPTGLRPSARPLPLLRPPRLKRGNVVSLIAPAGFMRDEHIERAVRNIESLGLSVKLSHNIRAQRGGYGGTVKQRLLDLHDAFSDRETQAVWAGRGGSGCNLLLPWIDYDLIRANPKALIGYSDITAVHLAMQRHSRVVSFHGPVSTSSLTDYTREHLVAALMEPHTTRVIRMAEENVKRGLTESHFAARTLKPGVAEGPLIGGNLTVLCALVGTPYAAQLRGALTFLEDVREPAYKLDRMLTQLQQVDLRMGEPRALRHSAGLMLGIFTRSESPDNEAALTPAEVFDDHLSESPVPAVYGYSFGHISHQFTIPLGVRARLDTEAQTLTLLEACVN